jgi:hypothetical protein
MTNVAGSLSTPAHPATPDVGCFWRGWIFAGVIAIAA